MTLTATGVNPQLIVIARAEDPSSESRRRRSGAEHVILPAAIGAHRIADLITRPSAEELLGREDGSRRPRIRRVATGAPTRGGCHG